MRRSYTKDFLPESLTVSTGSEAHSVVHDYDDDGLLTEVGSPEGTLTISRRAADGLVSGTTLGSVITVQDYTSHGELKLLAARYNSDTLYRASYDRDPLGRITAWHEREGATLRSREFVYDTTGRLWQVWDRQANPDTLIARYRYDLNGNRLAVAHAAGDSVVASYDDQDRLLSQGSTTYSYTASGFLAQSVTGSDTTRHTYDALGNLIRVATPSDTVEYRVDGLNRRVSRKANGLTTRWIWEDGLRPAAEVDGSGGIVARYAYGLRVNVPEYIVKADTAYRVITDHLGSARLLVNVATGAIAERVDYDAWGQEQGAARAAVLPFGFAGGIADSLTGLVRFGARDYEAGIGRWTSKDPILFRARSSNVFSFVSNATPFAVDPTGHDFWIEGPSPGRGGSEPPGHKSINVGDPNGAYESFSFGTDDPGLAALLGLATGEVYPDPSPGGNIEAGTYYETTPLEDSAIRNWLRGFLQEQSRYSLLSRSCRTFSDERLKDLILQGMGRPSRPKRGQDPSLPSSDPPFGTGSSIK